MIGQPGILAFFIGKTHSATIPAPDRVPSTAPLDYRDDKIIARADMKLSAELRKADKAAPGR
jgi:hypothetical protein